MAAAKKTHQDYVYKSDNIEFAEEVYEAAVHGDMSKTADPARVIMGSYSVVILDVTRKINCAIDEWVSVNPEERKKAARQLKSRIVNKVWDTNS